MKVAFTTVGCPDWKIEDVAGNARPYGFDGYLSLKWEKRWEPKMAPPKGAFPQYAYKVRAM